MNNTLKLVNSTKPKLKGQVSCHFTIENVEGHTLQGSIPLLLPPGKFKFPDTAQIQGQDRSWIQNWIKEADLPQVQIKTKEEEADFARDMAITCAYLLPSLDPGSDAMKIYVWIMALSFLGDDAIEGKGFLGSEPSLSNELVTIVGDIFRGKYESYESIPFPEDAYELRLIIKTGFLTATKANKYLPNFFEASTYIAESFGSVYSGMMMLELEDHYSDDEDQPELPVNSYWSFRKYEGGFQGFIELALLCNGIVPTQEMRRNVMFKQILELACSINAEINDLLGARKEIEAESGYNVVAYKSRFMELPLAFGEVLKSLQENILNFTALAARYRTLNRENQMIERTLTVLEEMIDGHIRWYGVTERYGKLTLKFSEG